MSALLELKDVKKRFPIKSGLLRSSRKYVCAVDGISLTVHPGENLSLVGESGCGKTTLGRIIIKLLSPDEGRVIFEGTDISSNSAQQMKHFRKSVQMIFQDPYGSLDPRFTVRNIMREAVLFDKTLKAREKDERSFDLLKSVGIPKDDILERYPHEFSGGERQRIAIARALSVNPRLLILDEAVSALDVLVQKQIVNLLRNLQEKFSVTYFFISHNLRVVKQIGGWIAVMYYGKIVELALSDELFSNPLHPYTKKLLCAAVDYKVDKSAGEVKLREDARFIERQDKHYVLE